jgi:hypothetical protein
MTVANLVDGQHRTSTTACYVTQQVCLLSPAGLAASHDGSLCVSISRDRSVKVYDVLGFDMIMMMKLPYTPGTAEWIFKVRTLQCCSG